MKLSDRLKKSASILTTTPQYVVSGVPFVLTGLSILAAFEQIAGQAFNLNYNTEADYAQENPNGTDFSGGSITLANTGGVVVDDATKLLLHFDGENGSTEIVDRRGVNPFGDSLGWFDGTANVVIPSSNKIAFGTTTNFTFSFWVRPASVGEMNLIDTRVSGSWTNALVVYITGGKITLLTGSGSIATTGSVAAGALYHIAVVREANVVALYVNGTRIGTAAHTANFAAGPIALGKSYDGNLPLRGWMSNLHVSKTARFTGASFEPPATETRDEHTIYLFKFSDGHGAQFLRDHSRSGHEVALQGTAVLSNNRAKFGTTSLRVVGTGRAQIAVNKFHADLILGSHDFTAAGWFWFDNFSAHQYLLLLGESGFAPLLAVNTSAQLLLYASTANNTSNLANGTNCGTVTAGAFHHIAMTRSGSNLRVFLNGALAATVDVGTSVLYQGNPSINVGGQANNTGSVIGNVDDFVLKLGVAEWTEAFTPPTAPHVVDDRTVALLRFDGSDGDKVTLDSSGSSYGNNAYADTIIPALTFQGGAALSSTYTRGGNSTALQLNGSSHYATLAYATPGAGHPLYFNSSEYMCLEGWFYFSSLTGSPHVATIFDSATGEMSFIRVEEGDRTCKFYIGGVGAVAASPAIPAGEVPGWHHIAAVREPRGWVVYRDGVAGTPSNVGVGYRLPNSATTLILGRHYNSSNNWHNGAIDSIRLTHGKSRYLENFTPGNITADDDTALCWVFNGSVGQKWVKELSGNTALIQATNARTVKDGTWVSVVNGGGSVTTAVKQFGTGGWYNALPANSATSNTFANPFLKLYNDPCFNLKNGGTLTYECFLRREYERSDVIHLVHTNHWHLDIRNGGAVWLEYIYDSAGNTSGTQIATLPLGTTVHFAVVITPAQVRGYVDGAQSGTWARNSTYLNWNDVTEVTLLAHSNGSQGFPGWIEEVRVSSSERYTGSSFTVPTSAFGQVYDTGPRWVATKPGVSALDLSEFTSIDNIQFTGSVPPNTAIKYLISPDAYATALKRWNGVAWVDSGHAMVWDGTALTTASTSAQLDGVANTWAELAAGLATLDAADLTSLNIVAVLSSANNQFTPALDNITITMDEYAPCSITSDITYKFKKADGPQDFTVTRAKAGNANMFFHMIA